MSDLSSSNPIGRFSGLAQTYARHRPTYPEAALALIDRTAGLLPGDLVIDVGCGTGISSRLMAARGYRVIGVEPNADMRAQAEEAGGVGDIEYRAGTAEETHLPDGCAALVLAAQAFHWFDAPRALAEFHRVLRPGGFVALVWNERDERDPFTHEYGELIRAIPGATALEGSRMGAGKVLFQTPLFEGVTSQEFTHEQVLDEEGLLGRAHSASYVPSAGPQAEALDQGLRALFSRSQKDGAVRMRYVTSVTLGRRHG